MTVNQGTNTGQQATENRRSMRELIDDLSSLTEEASVPTGHDLPYVHVVTTKDNKWVATFADLLEADRFVRGSDHGYQVHGNIRTK